MTTRTQILLVLVIPVVLIIEGIIYNATTHWSDPNRFRVFLAPSEYLSPVTLITAILAIGLGLYVRYRIGTSSEKMEKKLALFAKIKDWHADGSVDIDHILPNYFLRYSPLLNNLRLTNASIVYRTTLSKQKTYAANILVSRGSLDIAETFHMSVMVTILPATIGGKMRIWPTEHGWLSVPGQTDLGENEYNKEIGLQADPKTLPEQVLNPSFFAWYMEQSKKPFVTLEQNIVVTALRGKLSLDELELLWNQHQYVVGLVKKVGVPIPMV